MRPSRSPTARPTASAGAACPRSRRRWPRFRRARSGCRPRSCPQRSGLAAPSLPRLAVAANRFAKLPFQISRAPFLGVLLLRRGGGCTTLSQTNSAPSRTHAHLWRRAAWAGRRPGTARSTGSAGGAVINGSTPAAAAGRHSHQSGGSGSRSAQPCTPTPRPP